MVDKGISLPNTAHNITKTNSAISDFPILSPKDIGKETAAV